MDPMMSVSAVIAICLHVASQIAAKCPPNPLDSVKDCTANVLPDLSSQNRIDKPEAYKQHIQDSCTQSRLRDAANCIEDLVNQCKGTTDEEQLLHRLVNKEKTMGTVDYFCKHIAVYERHAECISSHHNVTWSCSQDAQKSFQTKMNAGASMDVLITGSCRFYNVARTCLVDTTLTYCGTQASTFVQTILSGLIPPYCDSTNPEYHHSDTTHRWRTTGQDKYDESGTNAASSRYSVLTISNIMLVLCCSLVTKVFSIPR